MTDHPITRPFFTVCATESLRYRNRDFHNWPVNLSLCMHIQKDRYSIYPDNVGKPAIEFIGCELTWIYNTEKERDEDFDRILRIFSS